MQYILKYNSETYELLEIIETKNKNKFGYVKNENAMYIPCENKEEAIKIYKSILRENIQCLKNQKKKINNNLVILKNKLQEIEGNEK